MGGIAVALFGVLGLVPWLRELASAGGLRSLRAVFARADGWLLRAVTVILIACGVAASWTAFALAGTARMDAVTAGGRSRRCTRRPATSLRLSPGLLRRVRVPGVRPPGVRLLPAHVAAAIDPVAAEIAGLPGAPVRAEEVASVSGGLAVMGGTSGNPPVFQFTAEHVGPCSASSTASPTRRCGARHSSRRCLARTVLHNAPSWSAGPGPVPTPAQQAVVNGLLIAVGSQPSLNTSLIGRTGSRTATWDAISAAAQRFARLSAAARHAWLATHLAALPASTITVAQNPVTAALGTEAARRTSGNVRVVLRPAADLASPAHPPRPRRDSRARRVRRSAARGAALPLGSSTRGLHAQQVPMIIEAGAAAVIAVTAESPFGEAENGPPAGGCPTCGCRWWCASGHAGGGWILRVRLLLARA